jgi:O-antigen/teichoic acid export membrane protein
LKNNYFEVHKILKKKTYSLFSFIGTFIKSDRKNDFLWVGLGNIYSKALTLFVTFFLARSLGGELFGKYSILNNTINLISGFAAIGLSNTVSRYLATYKIGNINKAGRVYALSEIIGVISAIFFSISALIFSQFIVRYFFNSPDILSLFRFSLVNVIFIVLNGIQNSALNGLGEQKYFSIAIILTSTLQAFLLVIFTIYYGINGLINGLIISSIITFFILKFFVNRSLIDNKIKPHYCSAFEEYSVLIKFSLPGFLAQITTMVVVWLSSVFLVNAQGYKEVGLFNLALQWDLLLKFIPGVVTIIYMPILSRLFFEKKHKEVYDMLLNAAYLVLLGVLVVGVLLYLFSPFLYSLLGNDFESISMMTGILILSSIFSSLASIIGMYLVVYAKMWLALYVNIFWGILFLMLSFFLTSEGALGLAFAYLFSYIVFLILLLYIMNKITKQLINE